MPNRHGHPTFDSCSYKYRNLVAKPFNRLKQDLSIEAQPIAAG
jgi:hypothetical protein